MLVKNNFTLTVSKQKQVSNIEYALKKKFNKIKLTGFIGSSLAYTASSIILKQNLPNIFILKDKESASYFANDIENLLNKSIFFPASFKKDYQVKKNDNSNTLLRTEVLNKINNSRNPIIVTYSEAVIEKVISQKELQNKSVKLSVNDNFQIDKLTSILEEMNFVKVDFILEPGQYAIRGGIVDIFSYSNENPYRIEFFDTTIESIRIFEINNQLSIQNEKEIKIIPNTELEKNTTKKICFLEYLPKTTLVWTEDIKYTLNSIKNYFKKIEDKDINRNPLFTSKEQFVKVIEKFTVIESNSHSYFTPQHEVKLDTDFLTRFNKQFDLLKQEMQKHTKQGIQNVILCSSEEQEKDLMQYLIKAKKLNTNVSILLFIRDILITLIILQYILIMKYLKDIINTKHELSLVKKKL